MRVPGTKAEGCGLRRGDEVAAPTAFSTAAGASGMSRILPEGMVEEEDHLEGKEQEEQERGGKHPEGIHEELRDQ